MNFELLAPVGGMEHLRAAVQAGADAVYFGGKLFNARINANNFDGEDMSKAVDYAHLRGVKVFITMNTLLTDEALEEAVEYAGELYELGVDGLIIQDWGLARMVRKNYPDFPIHLSTQGTVYNEDGVRAAKEMGFERIVLARELSLDEIAHCCGKNHPEDENWPEIEVFVHGALCVCYSGQCNMSRINGGRSGNQGLCAQPCRLKYQNEKGETAHFLSPKDMCGLDHIKELMDAGVTSFKIEGRMKSPEYVATVVSIYRKYMDLVISGEFSGVDEEDRKALLQAFNRGNFTDGYLMNRIGSKMMAIDVPKHQGIHIGKTIRRAYQGLVEIELDEGMNLNMGDGVEIHNRELSGNVVTYIKPAKVQGENRRKQRLIIGDINGFIKGGEEVFKITDKALNEKARELFKVGKDGNDVGTRRSVVSMAIELRLDKPTKLTVALDDANFGTIGEAIKTEILFEDIRAEKALNKPLDEERLRTQLMKLGDYPFIAGKLEVTIDEGITIPISSINKMRREVMDAFCNEIVKKHRRNGGRKHVNTLINGDSCNSSCSNGNYSGYETLEEWKKQGESSLTYAYIVETDLDDKAARLRFNTQNSLVLTKGFTGENKALKGKPLVLVPIELLFGAEKESDWKNLCTEIKKVNNCNLAFYINRVSKGKLDLWLDANIMTIKEAASWSGYPIFAGNISWLHRLVKEGIAVIADYGLNSCNESAQMALHELGAVAVVEALEYREDAIGLLPMMITEQTNFGKAKFIQSARRQKAGLEPMIMTKTMLGDKTLILG